MYINEAIIKAKEEGRGITRTSWGTRTPTIIPTNTVACMIVVDFENKAYPGLQPTTDDFLLMTGLYTVR